MPIDLYRIDDRLIHGQVVVGWGQPLNTAFIVLVDDDVATCDWERDLYRMGVPPEMEIRFDTVESAIRNHTGYEADPRPGILVTGDISTMRRFTAGVPAIREVNVGGLHHRAGREEKLRYVFLSPDDERELRELAASGVTITAQDVPAATRVNFEEILGESASEVSK
ncbi:MAG: PTS sugar transporter subunit IIB [Gemmatimonadaceae bacterium]|nr:PTS sugar transporter subunit IIB [Gemmatimonadaceae bacterium]